LKEMKILKVLIVTTIMVMSFTMLGLSQEAFASPLAATAPSLGAAGAYSVLGALSASSANTTTIEGNLGLSPGEELSRTGPWSVGGDEYFGPTGPSFDAQGAALGAYNNLAGQIPNGLWSGATAPLPGVWSSGSSETFTGTLTLNGTYDDVWVFQIPASLTFTGSVVMGGDAQACHVFWQVGESAVIMGGANFIGTLIAEDNITLTSGANVSGRIISLVGAITVDNNTINMPPCASAPVQEESTAVPAESTAVPTVSGLPTSGGAPLRSEVLPLGLAVLFGGLSIVVAVLIVRALRRNYQQKQ
jgi:hypothetical protein